MQLARLLRYLPIVLTACGGAIVNDATHSDGGAGGDGGLLQDGADAADAPITGPCKTPSGVRLCGNGCPSLSASECPGLGCVPVVDRVSSAPTAMGVCLADLPAPIKACWICPDGSTCAHLDGQGPVCVAEDVCAALFNLGAGAGCRFADFAPYDGRPLAVTSGAACPAGSCGPGCGECSAGNTECSGRSADFGYGMCFDTLDPTPCSANKPLSQNCERCLTWLPASAGDETALDYGQCAMDYQCAEYEATGRMSCHTQ